MTGEVIALHDRSAIAAWLQRGAGMHVYALADLDDFFWPHTQWWALRDGSGCDDAFSAIALLLGGFEPPVLYAVAQPDDVAMAQLLGALASRLPARCFVNLMRNGAQHLGAQDIRNQSNDSFAFSCALDELYGLGFAHYRTLRAQIEAVTIEEVRRVARKYFLDQPAITAIVHP